MGLMSLVAQSSSSVSEDDINEILLELNDVNTTSSSEVALFSGVFLFFWLAIIVVAIVGLWKVFVKAGHPGWAAIIPIYNAYILIKIAGRPGWWLLLLFVPFVNLVVNIIVSIDIAKAFGKSELFGVIGLWLFSVIGYLILGFGDAEYNGSGSGDSSKPTAPEPAAA